MAVVLTTHYMDEAERLSDRLLVLHDGRVRASGSPRSVLGDVVGEHIVVLPIAGAGADQVAAWLGERHLFSSRVLSNWHIPLDAAELAVFVAAFPHLRYEVRVPTLDDLFPALADEGRA
jgi:lipooligosaccharide transport system ATP-binding protein